MRILIAVALFLVAGNAFAQTDCRSVEHPDHYEAVCTGDEKAIAAPETPPSSAIQRGETLPQAAAEQMRSSVPAAADTPAQPQATAVPSPQTPQSQAAPGTIVHRQGRQQYQKGMDEARSARQQLIKELQQSQPAP